VNRFAAVAAALSPASRGGETVRPGGLGMMTITTITTPMAGTG
jgi:hypothetical protein